MSVTVNVEDLSQDEVIKPALTAFFPFVSLDAQGKTQPTPALEIMSPKEGRSFEEGRQRYLNYK